MKVHLANSTGDKRGGGWSFVSNFRKGFETTDYDEADIYFMPAANMVQRDEVLKAKEAGKKIVLRLDNIPRNSRNRNTGIPRLVDFAQWADLVVFQSKWAQKLITQFVEIPEKKQAVIYNGVDLDLFKPGPKQEGVYLYSRQNRDETKQYEMARYWFSQLQEENKQLWIAGQFSPDLIEGNFDFYMAEDYRFLGSQSLERMADFYCQTECFIYSYFNDACSNSLIEALASGCEIVGIYGMEKTGGAPEIIRHFSKHGRKWLSLERMCAHYQHEMEKI